MGAFDFLLAKKQNIAAPARAINMPASLLKDSEMLPVDKWGDMDGGLPEWVMNATDIKMHKWYGDPDKDGFWRWLRRTAVSLIEVIQLTRNYKKMTKGKDYDTTDVESLDDAVMKFDRLALTEKVRKNGLGILVKSFNGMGVGGVTIMAEMNTALCLDQTLKAFSGTVVYGKMVMDGFEIQGLDPKKIAALPYDGEEAKTLVGMIDSKVLKQFRRAAAENSVWQNRLQGACDTEKCIEDLLGDQLETAQDICEPGQANANDYEKVVKNWTKLYLKNSVFAWGVVKCDWKDKMYDFNDQMQWLCGALHAHTDDKTTEFFIRSGALPQKKGL